MSENVDDTKLIILASAIAHLLEYIDTGERLDRAAAMSMIGVSGLPEFAKNRAVLLPVRRDGQSQATRMVSP